jgi:uncharacterized protein YfbU (UPF0304 family)
MRKLKSFQIGGLSVQEVLDEFNERREEFGIENDSDIVSVSALPPTAMIPIAQPDGSTLVPKVEVVIVYWSKENPSFELSSKDKLILAMLCDISEHLQLHGEIDPKFVKAAVWDDYTWGLTWEYQWLFNGKNRTPDSVKEVVNIMEMWSMIETYYDRLSTDDKALVKREADPYGGDVRFPGFDANDEIEGKYVGIAQFLVDYLHRFGSLKNRDFNSHYELLDAYRRMLKVFESIRPQVPDTPISAEQLILLLNERKK